MTCPPDLPSLRPRSPGAREAGKLRVEGKEYVLREGDVLYFRFNV